MLNEPESQGENEESIGDYGNVTLGGSLREKITFADIEASQNKLEVQRGVPGAFENFREQFSVFFEDLLLRQEPQDSGFPSPLEPTNILVKQDENVCLMSSFQYIRVILLSDHLMSDY